MKMTKMNLMIVMKLKKMKMINLSLLQNKVQKKKHRWQKRRSVGQRCSKTLQAKKIQNNIVSQTQKAHQKIKAKNKKKNQ